MNIVENIKNFLKDLANLNQKYERNPPTKLLAVSKTKSEDLILEAYQAGLRDFGENKAQEMQAKYEYLPKDIQWHFIGHLQRNKVKYIAHFVDTIHAVDSLRLLQEINKQATKHKRIITCFLQIYIAQEESKFGLSFQEAEDILISEELEKYKNICIKGFMGMATFTDNQTQIRNEFKSLKAFYENVQEKYHTDNIQLEGLSMGMSNDYEIAIEQGSTMIRIGTTIFGKRNYAK